MDLPVMPPVSPMLATATASLDKLPAGEYLFEPKWDGFRAIVFRDGDELEIGSRGEKLLTRYFPELVDVLKQALPPRCVLDGEIVVVAGETGAQRLDWDLLAQRIHPAESRITRLAAETPASFIAFDALAIGDDSLLGLPFSGRRARLEQLFNAVEHHQVQLSRVTRDVELAHDWFTRFEGAGLDGVVAKPVDGVYLQGKRVLRKIKHARTAEAVVIGYRVHKSGQGVGSLLLGLYSPDGTLVPVGGAAAFSNARRLELIDELQAFVLRDEAGQVVTAEGEKNRFNSTRDNSFVPLRPELVVEVAFDQLEKHRFRHAVQVKRFRVDRDPRSCTYDQVEVAGAYDFGSVLHG